MYVPKKETVIQSDASSNGVGATLSQVQSDGTGVRSVSFTNGD